jgi:hypothetical protein
MQDSRPNIMFRKQKNYSGRNNTTAESEFSQQQARLEALKNKREQIAEHRRVTLYGSEEEKANFKSKVGKDAQLQLYIKEQKILEEKERNQRENEKMESHRTMLIEMERQREIEKKMRLREIQESNRIAALTKKSMYLENKIQEDSRDRATIVENVNRFTPNVF